MECAFFSVVSARTLNGKEDKNWINARVHSTFSEHVQLCRLSHHFPSYSLADASVWGTRSIVMSGHIMRPLRWERAPVGTTVRSSSLCSISGVGYAGSLHFEDADDFTQKLRRSFVPLETPLFCLFVIIAVTAVISKDLLIAGEADAILLYQDPCYLKQKSSLTPTSLPLSLKPSFYQTFTVTYRPSL